MGTSTSTGKVIDWYKSPGCGARRILKLARLEVKPKVYFLKIKSWDLEESKKNDRTTQKDNILIAVELTRKVNLDDLKSIEYKTYELWQDAP